MDPGSGGGGGGGGGGSSSSSDSAPDCWDQADMEAPGPGPCGGAGGPLAAAAAEAQREHLSAAFSRQLNVNAKPFVPNVHAAEFVPSFLRGPAQLPASPAGAAANNHGAGNGAGGPSGKGPGSAPGTGGNRAARAGEDGLGARAHLGRGPGEDRGRASPGEGRVAVGPGGTWAADSGAGCPGWGDLGQERGSAWGDRGGGREQGAGRTGGVWGRPLTAPRRGAVPCWEVGTVWDGERVSATRPRSQDRWSQESAGWALRALRSWGGRKLAFYLHLGPGRESFPRCNACY